CIANERKQLHTRRAPPERSQGALLTTREHEVAALLMQGLANKQIAKRLSIGVSTVKNHVHSILTKTGASSRLEAAVALGSLQPRQSG
ncbi:MAG: LuxR C-terminal-related transcriptional regulator, partial [Pseudomonadota bacterium]